MTCEQDPPPTAPFGWSSVAPGATAPKTILLLGPPGAGKTTQARRLARGITGQALSVGNLIRASGVRLPRGHDGLADTAATIALIQSALDVCPPGPRVVDGFPRSAEQVPAAIELLGPGLVCLSLQLDLETALYRMSLRGRLGEDRPRMALRYTQHAWRERALGDALQAHGIPCLEVDAAGDESTVATHVLAVLREGAQPAGVRQPVT